MLFSKVKSPFLFIILFFSLLGIAFSTTACSPKKDAIDNEEAGFLYNSSLTLISEITSEISRANDSLSVDSLFNLFEKRLTNLNFAVAPETDLKLTEQENDSIFILINKLIETKREKLRDLSKVDTIPLPD